LLKAGGVIVDLAAADEEDGIGKRVPFPSHLERPISEVVDLDVLAASLSASSLLSRMICLRS
jgi:hypothetical protein